MMSKTMLLFLQVIGVFGMVWASDEEPVVCGSVMKDAHFTMPCYVNEDPGTGEAAEGFCALLEETDEYYTCVLPHTVACKVSSPYYEAWYSFGGLDPGTGNLMLDEEGQPRTCVLNPGNANEVEVCSGGPDGQVNICVGVDAHRPAEGFCCSFAPGELE